MANPFHILSPLAPDPGRQLLSGPAITDSDFTQALRTDPPVWGAAGEEGGTRGGQGLQHPIADLRCAPQTTLLGFSLSWTLWRPSRPQ